MKMYALAMLQLVRPSQQRKLGIKPARSAKFSRLGQGHPAPDGGVIDPRKVYRGALARGRLCDSLAAGLHTANAKALAARQQFYFVASFNSAGDQRTGYYCAEAFHGEGAI